MTLTQARIRHVCALDTQMSQMSHHQAALQTQQTNPACILISNPAVTVPVPPAVPVPLRRNDALG